MRVVVTPPASEPVSVQEAATHCRLDEVNQEPAPTAPTCALAATPVAGNVDNGAHRYAVTFVTADGETQTGTVSASVTVVDKTLNGQVALTAIPIGGAAVTSRKIYRTAAGGSTYLLLATIANNTATTYTDNVADASLGVGAPSANTTGDPLLAMLIQAARQHAEQELRRYIITQTVDAYFGEFPHEHDRRFFLPPLQTVSAITYVDIDGVTQTLDPSLYLVDNISRPARIEPAYGVVWPSTREQMSAVKVRFVAGYGTAADVPACIKNWMLIRIKTLWDQRDQLVKQLGMPTFEPAFVDGLLDTERVTGRV